ncbi:efflux RND transporter permease subunit [Gloeobacter kilaueensis]|uniref:Acriflavin resistance protein n=1 Tax=Gloeobacter kilaueensis (strain ATCC BAA-2537 / CCAP 1431/1 / ULC 316 / JS1) TaxID=1183438 RepID=U5QCS4_GLOK1|nr:efflux RND transporter permease subunit [Gloeobacter kilaueensis]AGY56648.1 acriflavin resistance protein [Gloeobacter kilaueensis JS1]
MNSNLSAWSIRNPIITAVLFIALVLAGSLGFSQLQINENPNVDVPTVSVTITQSGAAPAELESQVTRKVEDAVAGIENVEHLRSTIKDGISTTTVEFVLGTNTDRAVNDVRDAVTKIRSNLPQDIDEPVVGRVDFVGGPLLIYSVASNRRTVEQLSWFVDDEVNRALLAVDGVSQVQRVGGVNREVRIDLDPDRLFALGITAGEVNRQVRELNLNVPGGRGEVGSREQTIRTLGSALTVEGLRSTEIALSGGRRIALGELGSVTDATAEARQIARMGGRPVVAFSVLRANGSSEVVVEEGVQQKIAELEKQFPDTRFELVSTSVRYVHENFDASVEALWLGGVLAIVVVYLFLRDGRATFIAGAAMPLSAIPTFAVMKLLGYSLNNLSLLALALVVGILVDDAIVEIENIVRHIKMGKTAFQAALDAADEIGLAVVATTMTIVAVFVPVGFMGGVPGQFFGQFGFTVVAAVLFSLLVARLVTPLMAAYMLKALPTPERASWYVRAYRRVLEWALAHRIATLLAAFAFFAGTLLLAPLIPSGFLATTDRAQSILKLELPPGATLAQTDRTALALVRTLGRRPEVRDIFYSVGDQGEVRLATLFINLKPRDERQLSQQQFEKAIRPLLAGVPGARLSFSVGFRGGKEVSIILTSEDRAILEHTAEQLNSQMRTLPGLANVSSTASLLRPELLIQPRFSKAADLGVSVQQIGLTAKIATLGDIDANLAKFNLGERQIPIRVQLDPRYRNDLQVIRNLRLDTAAGRSVPLETVAEVSVGSGSAQIDRYDRSRQISIEANLDGLQLGPALKRIYALPVMEHLPDSVRLVRSGDVDLQDQVSARFGTALGFGVLLIYAVLVLLFGNFFHPLTIMAALPLSIGGALIGLLVSGKALVLPALIGILMLMGIVTKNSILLVEYTLVLRNQEGLSRKQALLEAGIDRLQPILMTTIAMIAGMLPIALGIGAGSEFRSPMAVAVVGGLFTSTLLTLVVIPVLFTYIDDWQTWFTRRFTRPLPQGQPLENPAQQ